jgi:hypothetical protein
MRKKMEIDIPISWRTHARMATVEGWRFVNLEPRSYKAVDDVLAKYLESTCKLRAAAMSTLGPSDVMR